MEILQREPDSGSCPKAKYVICDACTVEPERVAVDIVSALWHKRLGHVSQRGMQMLVGKDLLLEVKNMY